MIKVGDYGDYISTHLRYSCPYACH